MPREIRAKKIFTNRTGLVKVKFLNEQKTL